MASVYYLEVMARLARAWPLNNIRGFFGGLGE